MTPPFPCWRRALKGGGGGAEDTALKFPASLCTCLDQGRSEGRPCRPDQEEEATRCLFPLRSQLGDPRPSSPVPAAPTAHSGEHLTSGAPAGPRSTERGRSLRWGEARSHDKAAHEARVLPSDAAPRPDGETESHSYTRRPQPHLSCSSPKTTSDLQLLRPMPRARRHCLVSPQPRGVRGGGQRRPEDPGIRPKREPSGRAEATLCLTHTHVLTPDPASHTCCVALGGTHRPVGTVLPEGKGREAGPRHGPRRHPLGSCDAHEAPGSYTRKIKPSSSPASVPPQGLPSGSRHRVQTRTPSFSVGVHPLARRRTPCGPPSARGSLAPTAAAWTLVG